MKISPHQIAAFTEIFRQRSISRAAAALGITQSAVTQHLANLERRMGTRLFLRHRTGLEPTKPALELFALTDRMRILDQLVAERIDAYGALESGHLTIIANAPRPAMPLVATFTRRYPGVRIAFSLLSWTLAMQRLAAREVDIAIITEPDEGAGLFRRPLTTSRYAAFLPRGHLLAARPALSLADLAREPVVLPEEGSLTQRVVHRALGEHGLRLERVVEMTAFPVVKEAVLHGIGIGILLEDSVFPTEDLVLRPIVELAMPFRTDLATPEDKRDLHFVRAFIEVASG
ncbi:LysR family transcriptional regulator [Rhabdaerophilum calidifontis]|uniref:LysR family transcriptional regulator n=1 Tax=Rhabdaerophilum calidifontis TaxID=2604328 RepID=UPI00140A4423|nr:LysR family transcriptional regulator [Rhabdaerophilum calidifontis]